jgi:hypothetical protein
MPGYKTEIAHDLGQKEAVERLRENVGWARGISDLKGTWTENTFTFSVSIQGIILKGIIRVEEDSLMSDVHLPLIATPFKSWLPNILRNALKKRTVDDEKVQPRRSDPAKTGAGSKLNEDSPTVLFLHIPKAGGTTLGEFVFNQCRTDDEYDEGLIKSGVFFMSHGFFKESDLSVPEHVQKILRRPDLRAVVGHFWFGLHEYINRPSTYITLLRNPVERIVSLYHYLKLEDKMSIEKFTSSPPFKEADNDQTRRLAGVDPEIGGCAPEHLRAAQENLRKHFSVVGVTERLDETLILLKRKFGWTKEIASYPRNVNPNKPLANSLSPEIREAIRKRNELDYELHQYANKLMDEAIGAEGSEFYDELEQYKKLSSAVRDSTPVSPSK